ncbi:MAG: 6-pyruvoyl trahydropterin synthase family protein [Thermoplasmatota archaeon]
MEIRVDGWRGGIRFDAAHILPHHEKCGRLHGHTYAIHAVVRGNPGHSGFIMDFGEVKRALRAIADRLDHHVLVATKSPDYRVEESDGRVHFKIGQKAYSLPREDVELLPIEYSTAESLAAWVAQEVLDTVRFPPGVEDLEVGLDESMGKGAWIVRRINPRP